MRKLLFVSVLVLSSCAGIGEIGETPRHALSVFCALKQSSIGTLLLTPETIAAGRLLCSLIGMGLGTP